MDTNELRSLCPALQNKTYFNYGGQGPLPSPSLEAITASWTRIQELGPFTADVWPYIAKEVNSTRRLRTISCEAIGTGRLDQRHHRLDIAGK